MGKPLVSLLASALVAACGGAVAGNGGGAKTDAGVVDASSGDDASVVSDAASACRTDANHTPSGEIWSHAFSTTGRFLSAVSAIDSQRNVIVAGWFEGEVDFGGGPLSAGAFVAKYDSSGHFIFARSFGDMSGIGSGLAVDANDAIYLAGSFQGSIDLGGGPMSTYGTSAFVAKLDSSGRHQWSRAMGQTMYGDVRVYPTPSRDVVVEGLFDGTLDVGVGAVSAYGDHDAFIVHLDAQGTARWIRHYGSARGDARIDLRPDQAGNLIGSAEFNQWEADAGPPIDFGCGSVATNAGGALTLALVKLDSSGACLASKSLAGTSQLHGVKLASCAVDATGGLVVLTGSSDPVDLGGGVLPASGGPSDVLLASYDAALQHRWSRRYHGDSHQGVYGASIALDATGSILVTGSFGLGGAVDFGLGPQTNVAFAVVDSSGVTTTTTQFCGFPAAQGICSDPLGYVVLTGNFQGTLDFGSGVLSGANTSHGSMGNVYLAKVAR